MLYPLAEKRFKYGHNVMAQPTVEKRTPRKGEWFLSGAFVEAYQAPNDLTMIYHLARLVRVSTTTTLHVDEVL